VKSLGFLVLIGLLSGCVSNKSIQTVQLGDSDKSCEVIRTELDQLGADFEEVKDDSGLTGKNVGLALLFWPGIIVNEVRSNKNEDSVDSRITYLTNMYNGKCTGQAASSDSQTLKQKLVELKSMLDEGLLTDEEYKVAKNKALETI
jgi:hypothetical protein